ncbi:hypothetical protein HYX02_02765 [Candidatus Woesearchaeota archaeon]|nr:hypothetical protein [Candidatus Woesearchaeota archaeon]
MRTDKLLYGLLILVVLVMGFNAYQISQLKGIKKTSTSNNQNNQITAQSAFSGIDVIPKGIPRLYGKELGVSYDDVSASNQQKADATIKRLGTLDEQINLNGKEIERYISIASQISCEYCCGVESIIFSNGKPACGCNHSYAMRGLAKYLIKNHGDEFTNDEILEELGKWKTLFFPDAIAKKAAILKGKGIELNYINLASNKYRVIENQ